MSYETGTYTTPKALFDRIVDRVQNATFMGAGNAWTLVYSYDGWSDTDAQLKRVIKTFLVPGPTGVGDFYVVLGIAPSTGTATTNFFFGALEATPLPPWGGATWITRGTWSGSSVSYARGDVVPYSGNYYVCEVAHTSTATNPGNVAMTGIWFSLGSTPTYMGALLSAANQHSAGFAKVWNGGTGDIPYWLFANPSRVMFVTKSDNRYHFAYAGGIIRAGSAAAHPLPTLLCGNNPATGDTYLDANADHYNFPLNHMNGSSAANSLRCPGNRLATSSEIYASPPLGWPDPTAPVGRDPAGNYPLVPVLLGYYDSDSSGDRGIAGTMDGVFITDIRGSSSENIITVGADNYLVIEDINRGQASHFLALKMA